MGEVYLAEDSRLSRKVALKLLPEGLTPDATAKQRFASEARVISALNEPHIVTIYDFGAEGTRDFIAMEYVDGQTLRDLLVAGKVEVRQALDLTAQAASGLAAAHDAGVIHRDIKPENLMVNRASQIKILDFGLAKLAEKDRASFLSSQAMTAASSPSGARAETAEGTILGTVSYMSSEQAAGRPLDHRTDIFSLGLVLYELLTGHRAFSGGSVIDILHAIINDEPRPAREWNPRLPREAIEVLEKAIAKDPADRYRHAGDMELDLRRVKRAIENRSVSSAASPLPRGRPRRPALPWTAVGIFALAAALGGWWLGSSRAPSTQPSSLADISLTPLTTDPGYEGEPTFSPDGETIAYVSDRTGNFEIFLKQVSGGPDINITNNPADDVQPAFSPDGKQIAFVSTRRESSSLVYQTFDVPPMGGDIWVMPALGGSPRLIARSGNLPSWSPDGSSILYTGGSAFNKKIFRVSSAGGEPLEIPITFPGERRQFLIYPRDSPDGRWILFESGDGIYVLPVAGGEPKFVVRGKHPAWGSDSRKVFYSNAEAGKNYSLWKVPFSPATGEASGPAEPLTVGRGRDMQACVSRDENAIAYTALERTFNLEILPFDAEEGRATGEPKAVTDGKNAIYWKSFSPDGRSLAFLNESHIWRLDTGEKPVQLTADPSFSEGSMEWSPDGASIAFDRRSKSESVPPAVWLMAADGANPRPLIERGFVARWLPDGRGLIYASTDDTHLNLFDLETKKARPLIEDSLQAPLTAVSPDGRWLVYQSTAAGTIDLHARLMEGGPSRIVVATPHEDAHPFISPSGKWLYFQPDHKNIYRVPGPAQDWRPAEPEKTTNFPESGLFLEDPKISRDGKQLVYSRGRITGDLWLWKRVKPSGRGDTR